jgi:hypothetical protein
MEGILTLQEFRGVQDFDNNYFRTFVINKLFCWKSITISSILRKVTIKRGSPFLHIGTDF